jgi:hypothetical protein
MGELLFLWEFVFEGEEAKELSPGAILENKIEFLFVLEALL